MSITPEEALRKVDEMKQMSARLGREEAAATSRLSTLREEYTLKRAGLKAFGIDEPSQIPGVLKRYEAESEQLLAQIEEGVPAEFKR